MKNHYYRNAIFPVKLLYQFKNLKLISNIKVCCRLIKKQYFCICASAIAIHTRCFWPPDNCNTCLSLCFNVFVISIAHCTFFSSSFSVRRKTHCMIWSSSIIYKLLNSQIRRCCIILMNNCCLFCKIF